MIRLEFPSCLWSTRSSASEGGRKAVWSRPIQFRKRVQEAVVGVDIGTERIQLAELDLSSPHPRLLAVGSVATPNEAIKNNLVVREDEVSNALRTLLRESGVAAKKVAFSLPTPSVFTKRIQVGARSRKELEQNIVFEAANYIPHKRESVHLDYQVLRQSGPSGVEVLLVAVKNEIIFSYLNAIRRAGVEPLIADIDCFALENMFAVNYPEERAHTVAIVNVGERYSTLNIIEGGESLFTGDVSIGGGVFAEAVCQHLQITPLQYEQFKSGGAGQERLQEVRSILTQTAERVGAELYRQLGFCWSAAGTENPIEAIFLGGDREIGSVLVEELHAKSGVRCEKIDCLRRVDCAANSSPQIEERSSLAISVGLALRRRGDKQHGVGWVNDPS